MKQLLKLRYALLAASLAVPFVADNSQAFTIDTFSDPQSLSVGGAADSVQPTGSDSNTIVDGVVNDFIGEERTITTDVTANPQGNSLFVDISGNDYNFASGPGVLGTTMIEYFGAGGTGLGGVDLTDAMTSDAFGISFLSADLPIDIMIEVGDADSTDTVTVTGPSPVIPGANSPQNLSVGFNSFTGIDFTAIESLKFTIDPEFSIGTDVVLDFLETFDDPDIPNPPDPDPDPDPTSVPEPGSMLGLLALSAWGATTVLRKRVK